MPRGVGEAGVAIAIVRRSSLKRHRFHRVTKRAGYLKRQIRVRPETTSIVVRRSQPPLQFPNDSSPRFRHHPRGGGARALGEDRGPADITTLACVKLETCRPPPASSRRKPCTLAGLPVAEQVFREQDARTGPDGPARRTARALKPGDTVLEIRGSRRLDPHRRAVRAQFSPAAFRRRDADAPFRRCRGRHEGENPRYAQDHARPARAAKICRALRRRRQSPLRPLRPVSDQGQPPRAHGHGQHGWPRRSRPRARSIPTPCSRWKSTASTRFPKSSRWASMSSCSTTCRSTRCAPAWR